VTERAGSDLRQRLALRGSDTNGAGVLLHRSGNRRTGGQRLARIDIGIENRQPMVGVQQLRHAALARGDAAGEADAPLLVSCRRLTRVLTMAGSRMLRVLRRCPHHSRRLDRSAGRFAAVVLLWSLALPVQAQPAAIGLLGGGGNRLQQVSETLERQLGPRHPLVLRSWALVASFLEIEGDLAAADRLYRRVLDGRLASLGSDHPDSAEAMAALAGLRSKQGRFAEALDLHSRALAIRQRRLGPAAAPTLESLQGLASLYSRQGLWPQAETLMRQVLQVRSRQLGEHHPETAVGLNNLGMLMERQSRWYEAETWYRKALAVFGEAWGQDDLAAALAADNLARALMVRGQAVEAEALQRRALSARERLLGSASPRLAVGLGNLAETLTVQGRTAAATPLLERGLALLQQAVGAQHPDSITLAQNLAMNRWLRQRRPEALALLTAAQDAETLQLQRELPLRPRAEREALVTSLGEGWLAGLSLAAQDPTQPAAVALALRARLNRHGLLQSLERQQALVASQMGGGRDLVREIQSLQAQLADLSLEPTRRRGLQARRDQLERQLLQRLPQLQPHLVSPAEVAAALPPDAVLIELQRYDSFDPAQPVGTRWGAAQLMALVVPSGASRRAPQLLPLGPAAPLEQATNQALAATLRGSPEAQQRWDALGKRFWTPLRPSLQGVQAVALSLDGDLHRVPLAVLQQSAPAGVRLQLLTSGRDLLPQSEPTASGSPVVIADPLYARSGSWTRLPGTLLEGRQIAAGLGVKLIHGAAATAARLKGLQQPRLLHVASHGYFKPEPARGDARKDPMQRSGLVLAPRSDDGTLSAAEVARMNLAGTRLVTLSACDTGRGVRRVGEAVYGLQRSLRVAGAQATLLSLWKVDDMATRELMQRFYGLLHQGLSPSLALQQVQLQFRQDPVLRGRGWQHPFYWAAWQLVGQDAGSRLLAP